MEPIRLLAPLSPLWGGTEGGGGGALRSDVDHMGI
jgi:hypothetical protein